jgi:energy-coupling factor transporter transmembrane protein EcfT
MHPLIRILCFLVFAAWLAWGDAQRLLFGAALLALLYAVVKPASLRSAGVMIRRLRWLLVSLLIVYGWFTPGRPIAGLDAGASPAFVIPTVEGLTEGLLRCAALVAIVLAVNLLLRTTDRIQLLGAIHGLARPLAVFGLSRERLALRMVLVMDAVEEVRRIVADRLAAAREGLSGMRALGSFASGLVVTVIEAAGRRGPEQVTLTLGGTPPALQWTIPVLLWAAFYTAGMI